MLIVVPVALYLFLYQRSRIEDATIRNFRALGAATERVDEVLERLSSVVNSSSFGISPSMLDEVTEVLTGGKMECGPDREVPPLAWLHAIKFPPDLLRSRQPTAAQRLQYRHQLAAHILFESNKKNHGATSRLWNQLHCLIDTHRRYSRPNEPIEVEVNPSPRIPLLPSGAYCTNMMSDATCIRIRELLAAEPCPESAPSPRLNAAPGSMAAMIADCRTLRERHRDLHTALKPFYGSESVIQAIDLFAIRSTAQLDGLIKQATGYLSRFFDSHLIADGDGRILFEAEALLTSGTESDESQVATPAFSSHVDISELLRVEFPRSGRTPADAGSAAENRAAAASAPAFRGRSFVKTVDVADVVLRVFVHPFILDSIDVSHDSEPRSDQGRASSNGTRRPIFYLVGIVDDSEFRSAAIKLRLSLVVDATLILVVLLTLSPLLWYWTAGDRLVVRRPALTGICAFPVVGVVLFTVLACGMLTTRMDEHVLDSTLEGVSDRIAELFDRELREEVRTLQRAVPHLVEHADREEPRRRQGERIDARSTTNPDGRSLSRLEREFYCDDSNRNLDYEPRSPEIEAMFLLDDEGTQRVCLGGSRPARTPKLILDFRDYFRRPREGALWRSPPIAQQQPIGCRIREAQDEESLIPCIVDRVPEPSKRLFHLGATLSSSTGTAGVPYFLDRIDSVVGGQVETILAINTGRPRTPVAATGVPLNSLDRAVPPQHVDFAVIDRETGRTLFHSDDDLVMTTNFAEDVGGDPALWSLLRTGARGTIGLVYAGIPIRAHVRLLRAGMPWILIVYRGHEVEDRLATVTTGLSIFFTLLWLFLVVSLAGLLLLLVHWCRPEQLEGLPAILGRVMATGSRFRWPFGLAIAVALVSLLWIAWLAWHPWSSESGWTLWRVLPFFAVHSVVAVVSFVLCGVLVKCASTKGQRYGAGTIRRALVLGVVIAGLAVVPAALWFGHHRAALGVGLNHYLVDLTLESVARAREDYRLDRLRQHGVANAPAGDRMRHRLHEEPQPEEGWIYRVLRPVMASSKLSNELMIYRALPPATADDVASLHGVFNTTFRYDIGSPLSASHLGRFLTMSLILLLLMALLIGTIAYSICVVCTIIRSRRRGIVKLLDADAVLMTVKREESLFCRPLRAIVLYRSERDRQCFLRQLTQNLRLVPHHHRVDRHDQNWSRYSVDWMPENATAAKGSLYVFDDMKKILETNAEGHALFDELARKTDARSGVLVWSRVVPDYRYSDRFGPDDRWFEGRHGDDEDRRGRWRSLAREFRSYVLCYSGRHKKRFDGLLKVTGMKVPSNVESAMRKATEAMKKEVAANPDLLHVARDVVADTGAGEPVREDTLTFAVATLRESAASYFSQIWTESTRDERLQLYALARGGVVDSRRTSALSSLVNRGIVEVDDDTGVVRLRSEAFGEFIEHDVGHGELDAWRKEGGGGVWRLLWPPLAIGAVLGLAFLALANPEMRTALLTTLLGLAPAILPFLRGGQSTGTAAGE